MHIEKKKMGDLKSKGSKKFATLSKFMPLFLGLAYYKILVYKGTLIISKTKKKNLLQSDTR